MTSAKLLAVLVGSDQPDKQNQELEQQAEAGTTGAGAAGRSRKIGPQIHADKHRSEKEGSE